MEITSKLAECAGLWLAEGDNKTIREITFTNNSWHLIKLFYERVIHRFKGNPRIYIYSAWPVANVKLDHCNIKYYKDSRARKPYYILRLASTSATKDWKIFVSNSLQKEKFYVDILRGFFAGEGNIKFSFSKTWHGSKVIRISQKTEKEFINKMLNHLGISYRFRPGNRQYDISGKWNWDIFAEHGLANLHPDKSKKFLQAYKNQKEDHYPNLFLKNSVFEKLDDPLTAEQLSLIFKRSQDRICDILMELKKENKIKNFRVRSKDYWTNKDVIIISKVKADYLGLLNKGFSRTSNFAKHLEVNWKVAFKRLKEIERLGLAKSNEGLWQPLKSQKEIIVI